MRRVIRFVLDPALSEPQRKVLVAAHVEYESRARRYRGRSAFDARLAAQDHRELIAAFCVPLLHSLDLTTGQLEPRRRLAPVIGTASA